MNKKYYFILLMAILSIALSLSYINRDRKIEKSYNDQIFIDGDIDFNNPIEQNIIEVFNIEEQTFATTQNELVPFYKKQLTINYSVGMEIVPEFIVIHETNNLNPGADANAHYRYWSTNRSAQASAHFVVDSTQIYQLLELNQKAWHVGDNRGHSNITNDNTIGIEIAVNSDGNYENARQIAIELTIRLMQKLDMNIDQLKRHYDASGKKCPAKMIDDPSLWIDFVYQVDFGLQN